LNAKPACGGLNVMRFMWTGVKSASCGLRLRYDPLMHPSLREIQALQSRRGRTGRELSIGATIEREADEATRVHRRLGQLIGLWQELMPQQVADHTALSGLRHGVLHVIVDSAATAFEVDRLLRSGVEARLKQRFRGSLMRVRTRVGTPGDERMLDEGKVKPMRKRGGARRRPNA
jgi:hypothetical protein